MTFCFVRLGTKLYELVSGSIMPPDLAHAKSGWFVNFENLGNVQPWTPLKIVPVLE
jgi:hypothetical protein